MFKRTKGYILLCLLVITGMGSQISRDTIESKERKILVSSLKGSKNNLLQQVKGLSEEQLNYKAAADKWSIRECVYHIALSEETIWKMAEAAIAQPANPEKRSEIKISDEDLVRMMTDRSKKFQAAEMLQPVQAKWQNTKEAIEAFKESRSALLKYAKTTTADLRNHVSASPMGSLDAYQLLVMISAHSARHTLQIEEVKSSPGFPAK